MNALRVDIPHYCSSAILIGIINRDKSERAHRLTNTLDYKAVHFTLIRGYSSFHGLHVASTSEHREDQIAYIGIVFNSRSRLLRFPYPQRQHLPPRVTLSLSPEKGE